MAGVFVFRWWDVVEIPVDPFLVDHFTHSNVASSTSSTVFHGP